MTFLMMVAAAVGVGWFAQTKKGRVGVKWALGTFGLQAGAWCFMAFCIALAQPGFLGDSANALALGFSMTILGGGIMLVSAWSLPNPPKPQ